jgi:hypothetical protein
VFLDPGTGGLFPRPEVGLDAPAAEVLGDRDQQLVLPATSGRQIVSQTPMPTRERLHRGEATYRSRDDRRCSRVTGWMVGCSVPDGWTSYSCCMASGTR